MSHLQESKLSCRPMDRGDARYSDVSLMSRSDVLVRVAEWGNEYPILLTLQVRTGALSTALREFGAMCLRAENYEMAVEAFLAAVSLKPEDCWLWRNLSSAYQGASDESRAMQCIRRALDLDTSHAEVWVQYGTMLWDIGQAKQAVIAFERAIALDAEDVEARYALGSLLLVRCRFSEAAELFEVCLKADPHDRLYHLQIGYARYMSGKFEDSAFHYRAAAAMAPLEKEDLRRYAKSVALRLALVGTVGEALQAYPVLVGSESETFDDVMEEGVAIMCANDMREAAADLKTRFSHRTEERARQANS